jgi:hypothetical protein
MLAEIFFLRLEALLRASQEAVPEKDSRFVSIPRCLSQPHRASSLEKRSRTACCLSLTVAARTVATKE